jgi:hypothetical protein
MKSPLLLRARAFVFGRGFGISAGGWKPRLQSARSRPTAADKQSTQVDFVPSVAAILIAGTITECSLLDLEIGIWDFPTP